MPVFSFIILTYNSENYIARLLNSIFEKFEKEVRDDYVDIIVVDNNSKDDTLKKIADIKSLRIIKNEKNFGFSKGINIGVSSSRAKFSIIINPDSIFEKGSMQETEKKFDSNDKLAVLGGKILNESGSEEKSAGRFIKSLEILITGFGLDEALGLRISPNKFTKTDFVSGAFMIVRNSLFKKIKGFDENLFMYVEDMEYCYRVKENGFVVYFDPEISIVHLKHGSSSKSFAIENIYKGLLYFQKKHGSEFSLFFAKLIFRIKAYFLVLIGKMTDNKYLTEAYSKVLSI